MFFTFRNRWALTLIRIALAILAVVLAPSVIDAVGGCSGGSMGPSCSRLPDVFGSLSFSIYLVLVYSGLYFLALLTVAILLLGGMVFELDARWRAKK